MENSSINWEILFNEAYRLHKEERHRIGQAVFNLVSKQVKHSLRGTLLDCYHHDILIIDFVKAVREEIGEPNEFPFKDWYDSQLILATFKV